MLQVGDENEYGSLRDDDGLRERLATMCSCMADLQEYLLTDMVEATEFGLVFPDALWLAGQITVFSAGLTAITRRLYGDAEDVNLRRITGTEGE